MEQQRRDDQTLRHGKNYSRKMRQSSGGDDESVEQPVAPTAFHEPAEQQSGGDGRNEKQDRIGAGVLREPDVVIGERQQRGGQQRLALPKDGGCQARRRPDARHAEQNGGEAQGRGGLAHHGNGPLGQQRIQRVLVVIDEDRQEPSHGRADGADQREDFVHPQIRVQRDQSKGRGGEQ